MSVNWVINLVFLGFDLFIFLHAWRSCFSLMQAKSKSILKTYEDLEQFHEDDYELRYEDIDNVCQSNESIKEIWNNFKGTITRHTDENGQHRLFSTVSAGDFFRLSDITKEMNVSYWQNLGGIFTGIGIFGTFLGLVIGLWGVNLSSSDVAVLKEGIGNLLNGISVAFVTSLIGILFALIYGFLHHNHTSTLQKSVGALALQIEKMYPRATAEQWLSYSFQESKEQTRTLKNLSQDMAEQLGDVLDAQLSTGFDELCEKLDSQMRPVFEKLYDAISALNDGGVNAIAGAVNEKAGAELQAFAGVLSGIQITMQESIRASQESSERANQILQTTMSRFSEALEEGTNIATKQQQSAVNNMAEQMQNVANILNQASENAMNNINAASMESKKQLKDSMDMTQNATAEMLANMKNMTEQQNILMDESARKSKARTDETIELLQKTLFAHNKSFDESYRRIQDVANVMQALIEQTNASTTILKDSVEPITKATFALRTVLEENNKKTLQIQSMLEDQAKKLTENGIRTEENIRDLINTIEKSEKQSEEAWNRYKENFENVSGELQGATDLITEKLGQYNSMMDEGMSKQLENFDKSVANAATCLNATVEELRDIVEDLLRKK